MNNTTTTHKQRTISFSLRRFVGLTVAVLLAGAVAFVSLQTAKADNFDDRIRILQSEIDSFQSEAARLSSQSASLQREIAALTAQKSAIQAQVDLSQAKYDKLVAEIAANEKRLATSQDALSSIITSMIVEGQVTPIEILASSSSVGDYLIRHDRLSSTSSQLQSSIDEINRVKKELAEQKVAAEKVLKDQQSQRDMLAAKEAEQSKLLAATQGQEANYMAMVGQRSAQVSALRAEQAAAMNRAGGGGSGARYGSSAYPWPNAAMNYDDNCVYPNGSSGADDWGYCKRQCVSYVAWKLETDGRGNRNFSYLGHARGFGSGGSYVPVDNIQPGDVIVWYIGYYGHVMYVDWVSGDSVGISQMNVPYDSGAFSTDTYSKSTLRSAMYEARRFH